MRVVLSPEAEQMVGWAKQQIVGARNDHRRVPTAAAIDWLLRDLCEYGSPVAGAMARKVWPDSVETREWNRKMSAEDAG